MTAMARPAITSELQSRPTALLGIDTRLLLIDHMHEALDILDLSEASKMSTANADLFRVYCLAAARAHHDFLVRHPEGQEMREEVLRAV